MRVEPRLFNAPRLTPHGPELACKHSQSLNATPHSQ
jgi:hypothetical protein